MSFIPAFCFVGNTPEGQIITIGSDDVTFLFSSYIFSVGLIIRNYFRCGDTYDCRPVRATDNGMRRPVLMHRTAHSPITGRKEIVCQLLCAKRSDETTTITTRPGHIVSAHSVCQLVSINPHHVAFAGTGSDICALRARIVSISRSHFKMCNEFIALVRLISSVTFNKCRRN